MGRCGKALAHRTRARPPAAAATVATRGSLPAASRTACRRPRKLPKSTVTMGDVAEHKFTLMPARTVAWIGFAGLMTWGGLWLLVAVLGPLTARPEPPPTGFFLAMLPVVLLLLMGPVWGLGGTLVVTMEPGRALVRRDRPGRPGKPVVIVVPPGARLNFGVDRMRGRNRNHGMLLVAAGQSLTRIDEMAGFSRLSEIAATLNGMLERRVSS